MEPQTTGPTQKVHEHYNDRTWHGIKLSKSESDLYGDLAPVVRRLGDAVQAIQDATAVACLTRDESKKVDGYGTIPPEDAHDLYPDSDDSSWIVSSHTFKWHKRADELNTALRQARALHHHMAEEALNDTRA